MARILPFNEISALPCRELVKNYDIAGVVFDDYFYPSGTDKFDDAAAYKKYGGGLSLADWRRKNTTDLVRKTYEAVKAIDSSCLFGVSPSGIWQNSKNSELGSATNGFESYSQIYADTRGWVKEGILDYIAPQIYWPIGYSAADYQVLVDWWSDVCDGTDVKLMISHAAYKVGDSSPAAWTDPMTIPNQIAYNRKKGTVSGSIFYGYSKISSNTLSLRDNLATLFGGGSLPTVTPDPAADEPHDPVDAARLAHEPDNARHQHGDHRDLIHGLDSPRHDLKTLREGKRTSRNAHDKRERRAREQHHKHIDPHERADENHQIRQHAPEVESELFAQLKGAVPGQREKDADRDHRGGQNNEKVLRELVAHVAALGARSGDGGVGDHGQIVAEHGAADHRRDANGHLNPAA